MQRNAMEWLALSLLPGVGASRLAALVAEQPAWPDGWLAALPHPAAQALRLWLEHPAKSPLAERIEVAAEWLATSADRDLLHPGHPAWPEALEQIADPPPVLWAMGDPTALEGPRLAMVGTRRPTREGRGNAAGFARQLAEHGWCVVSGMALGIDGIAQQAALDAGGQSIAVLGCGVDVIYPARHRHLQDELRERGGLLLSEHPPGTRARAGFFPRRNRLITGLSRGVLVVEAAERSGSLVSARLAAEQGREVLALPGSIHNPQARGCLHLIREGAALVRDLDDLLAELVGWSAVPVPMPRAEDDAAHSDPLLGWLSDSPTPVDVLVELSGLAVAECQRRLLMLELEGQAAQASGGWVRLPSRSGAW
ncbi:DNA-processing protein DprA [Halomonas halmophila]|uniref:DNA processing protein DprA n=1 Tax=Halomonas halmophila TaxID=252 RepID=A0A4Y4F7F3_9GAMM|nr:DNA-processing protein DprA [Halomonas halmophila]GED23038.1 DNA processing protein DprA [Halomonas halmophila]